MSKYSIVEYFSGHEGHKCGYCGSEDTSLSHGMWAHSLTVADYQGLINRGWRRSGKYVYKPTMDMTCCPLYVIRCAALDFKLSKSQKKTIKRNNKYFNTGVQPGGNEALSDGGSEVAQVREDLSEVRYAGQASKSDVTMECPKGALNCETTLRETSFQDKNLDPSDRLKAPTERRAETSKKCTNQPTEKKAPTPGVGADPTRPPCKKAKQIRLERKLQKQGGLAPMRSEQESEEKTLEEHLSSVRPDSKHKLEIRLCRSSPGDAVFKETFNESYKVYKKYQEAIHGDAPDKVTQSQYTRFLVDSPLEAKDVPNSQGYGSFHQHYVLNGKIIAVAVLDILHNCVSSVYLYYDPQYRFLSLGTYSALRELGFIRELHTRQPSITHYYMGFYIHACPKMRYKANYTPSFLCCPETYNWFPVEYCRPRLDAAKYCRFDAPGKEDEDGKVVIAEVMCLHQRQPMPYMIYKAINPGIEDEAEVDQYATLAGMPCARSLLLYRAPVSSADSD